MTDLQSGGAATGTGVRSRPRAVLPALCLTQITSWGIVYYAFPVLNAAITADTGWSGGATTAAFSAALVVSAVAGIYVGRVLDHRGPRTVMTAGSVLGVLSLLVIAAAPNLPVFFAGWLLAGAAMAATFYQPAFAALTRWWAPDHIRALTIVTLAAWTRLHRLRTLTAILADHMSWRATYTVLMRHPRRPDRPGPRARPESPVAMRLLRARRTSPLGHEQVVRSRAFWMLAATFALSAFAMYAVVIGLVPLLLDRGCTTTQAAWALGLGGAGQTLGRTLYATLARHLGVTARTVTLIALGALATAALATVAGPYALLVAVSVLAGVIRGNLTLLQATAVTDRWGTTHYGRLSGLLGAPAHAAAALAPFVGALLAGPLGGYPALFALLAVVLAAAAVTALGARPPAPTTSPAAIPNAPGAA